METELNMTLYELNQQAISQLDKTMEKEKILEKLKSYKINHKSNFYMLLCKDYSYYTIFQITSKIPLNTFENEACSIITELGNVVTVAETDDNEALEIWIKIDETAYCFYLFDYSKGVIECI